MHLHVHECVCVCVCMCMFCVHVCLCVCVHVHLCMCMQAYVHACMWSTLRGEVSIEMHNHKELIRKQRHSSWPDWNSWRWPPQSACSGSHQQWPQSWLCLQGAEHGPGIYGPCLQSYLPCQGYLQNAHKLCINYTRSTKEAGKIWQAGKLLSEHYLLHNVLMNCFCYVDSQHQPQTHTHTHTN